MFLRQITNSSMAQNADLTGCQRTGEAVVVDPGRDVDRYLKVAAENGLRITAVAETHLHADYLGGARELMERHGVIAWPLTDRRRFPADQAGRHLSPGHTPEHLSFLVNDHGGGATEPMPLLMGHYIFVSDQQALPAPWAGRIWWYFRQPR